MALDIVAFVRQLTTPGFTPTAADLANMRAVGDWLCTGYKQLDDQNQDLVVAAVKAGMASPNPAIAAIAFNITHVLSADVKYFAEALIRMFGMEADTEFLNGNFFSLAVQGFNRSLPDPDGASTLLSREYLHAFYSKIVRQIEAQRIEDGVDIRQDFRRTGRAVVLATQITAPPHAPTVDALKFADYLQRQFGKEVLVVNSMQFSPEAGGAMVPSAKASENPDLRGCRTITYGDQQFAYFQPSEARFSRQSIAATIRAIEAFDPEIIVSVGSSNMLSELFAARAFCFRYPTDADVPLTLTNFFHTWKEPTPEMLERVQIEGLSDLYLFHKHPGFDVPAKHKSFTRADFGIPEDAFVFGMVGTRLQHDVDTACMDALEALLEKAPNAYIAFAGTFPTYQIALLGRPLLKARSCFTGFQTDIMAFHDLCNGYINPHRKGGGSAIIYAMAAGLPAVSTSYGDAAQALVDLPHVADYAALVELASKIACDAEFASDYAAKCKEASLKLTSRKPLMDMIMYAFDQFAEGRDAMRAAS